MLLKKFIKELRCESCFQYRIEEIIICQNSQHIWLNLSLVIAVTWTQFLSPSLCVNFIVNHFWGFYFLFF